MRSVCVGDFHPFAGKSPTFVNRLAFAQVKRSIGACFALLLAPLRRTNAGA